MLRLALRTLLVTTVIVNTHNMDDSTALQGNHCAVVRADLDHLSDNDYAALTGHDYWSLGPIGAWADVLGTVYGYAVAEDATVYASPVCALYGRPLW